MIDPVAKPASKYLFGCTKKNNSIGLQVEDEL